MINESDGVATPEISGRVIAVDGSHAKVRLDPITDPYANPVSVGRLLELVAPASMTVAVVTSLVDPEAGPTQGPLANIDLLGEIVTRDGRRHFQRGITGYPVIGSKVGFLKNDSLRLIYDTAGPRTINIGALSQDASVPAYINVDEMLHKHFAVLGTTGVGKSSGVAVVIREVMRVRPKQRIFMLDPHNEYGFCFGDRSRTLSPTNLRLPHWLFNFEEIVDVVFRARPGVEEEVEILAQAITEAKIQFAEERDPQRPRLRKGDADGPGFTVDTPVPYRMPDVISLIDKRMGKLENRSQFAKYYRLITRIETIANDPRYRFMYHNANVGGDTMVEVLDGLFNLTNPEKPVSVLQLAGFPAEVVDSLVSVLCRMAFEFGLWSGGAIPLLMVCEEAHRYAPADKGTGFGPTRKSISRISKEGRKYGVFIGLITQRPAELDPTIVSQCSTLFAMRMANERDQEIVKSAVSDAAAGLLAFVPALGVREVFAFGEGVALPARIRFGELPKDALPRSATLGLFASEDAHITTDTLTAVVERWRAASMSKRRSMAEPIGDDSDIMTEAPAKRRPAALTEERAPSFGDRLVAPQRNQPEANRSLFPAPENIQRIRG